MSRTSIDLTSPLSRKGYKNKGTIDWRAGAVTHKRPTTFQARSGGPPLLFMTDIRMSVLVTLANSPIPYGFRQLERALGNSNLNPCIRDLVDHGLLATWQVGRSRIVGLDPCHPCHESLVRLLIAISKRYEFPKPLYLSDGLFVGVAPERKARRRDVRMLFGNSTRTLALLAVYVMGSATHIDVGRAISLLSKRAVNDALWRFHAFGILRSKSCGPRFGIEFELNPEFAFAAELETVLADVALNLPMWAGVFERYGDSLLPSQDRKHRRKPSGSDAAYRRWSKAPLSLSE